MGIRIKTVYCIIILSTLSLTGCGLFNGDSGIDRTDWAFEITQIDELSALGLSGQGVTVGIVDTGVDADHSDLDHIDIIAWEDFIAGKPEPYDDIGHGTNMVGILAANGKLDGIAPDIDLIVVKALGESGGKDSDVAEGVEFCVDNGADVILLSLGGGTIPILGTRTEDACNFAINNGVFVAAAADNDGENDDGDVASPASVPGVIAVGAVDKDKKIASFSSRGDNDGISQFPFDDTVDPNKKPEIVAPGVGIASTYKGGKYVTGDGTSQSAAFMAGIIALLLESHPGKQRRDRNTVIEFKNDLMDTAEKTSYQESPHDDHYGYGLIQAFDLNNRW
jgi:serine protease AprX